MAQIEQTIPEAQALCVEYPGYIQNFEAALETLGGFQKIAQSFQLPKPGPLSLHFRPDDPLSHPLDGVRRELSGCLLRFSRKLGAGAQDAAPKAEIVARTTTSYSFTGIADYQYASSSVRSEPAVTEAESEPFSAGNEPLLCLPTRFSYEDAPLDYSFRSFYSKDPAEYKAGKASELPGHVWSFQDFGVPPPAFHLAARKAATDHPNHVSKLVEMFQERPAWSNASLSEQLPECPAHVLQQLLLSQGCYIFRNGPWRHLWLRNGYDPRQDASSCKWQSISYHLPPDWFEVICKSNLQSRDASALRQSLPIATNRKQLHSFQALPSSERTVLQLYDIEDDEIQRLLKPPLPRTSADAAAGWLSSDGWKLINNIVPSRFQQLLSAAEEATKGEASTQQMSADMAATPTPMKVDAPNASAAQLPAAEAAHGSCDPASTERIAAAKHATADGSLVEQPATTHEAAASAVQSGGAINGVGLQKGYLTQLLGRMNVKEGAGQGLEPIGTPADDDLSGLDLPPGDAIDQGMDPSGADTAAAVQSDDDEYQIYGDEDGEEDDDVE
ncbi:hypothetical protein WJX74_002871 [Apatococcus lobatus]|uniref:Transcription factor IIIC subunit 5 HTH domain-containing protein n=1 Tax=Apatococcus lobatus TaxID=904363 RepID=A0AAW1RY54_9CHLO